MVELPLMVRWVIGLIPHGRPITRSNQCSMTGVTNVMECTILSVGCILKKNLLLIKEYPMKWQQQVSSDYLSGPLPYGQHHITINKMC